MGILNPLCTKYADALQMLLIDVQDKETLENLRPAFNKALSATSSVKEVVVTARSTYKQYDFYSRCFCPWIGTNEDPVTGAAHSVLGKYWGDILKKTEIKAYQCSKRGGYMILRILNDTELEISGSARTIFEGQLMV